MNWPKALTKVAILRAAICLVSIFLLMVLGALGDLLPNVLPMLREMRRYLPEPVSFVLQNYPLNSGYFFYSLTPWMIFFAALIFQKRYFLYWFVLAWLLAAAYSCTYVFVLTTPYEIMLAEMARETLVKTIVTAVDGAVILSFILVWILRLRKITTR